jgi:hypothetical protein
MRYIVELEDPDANPATSPHAAWTGEYNDAQSAIEAALNAHPDFRFISITCIGE